MDACCHGCLHVVQIQRAYERSIAYGEQPRGTVGRVTAPPSHVRDWGVVRMELKSEDWAEGLGPASRQCQLTM